MRAIRLPAFAGRFYPADVTELRSSVHALLDAVPPSAEEPSPKALIVPHAGYLYSGPIAASGFARLRAARTRGTIERVVLLGTAHSPATGIVLSGTEGFATPLGVVPLDREALAAIREQVGVVVDDVAHDRDHALEIQLPFLQEVLGAFRLVPILVGRTSPEEVADVLETLWEGDETLIVVSSDLSHYHGYEEAQRLDRASAEAIEALSPGEIGVGQACGHRAIGGLLLSARRHGLLARAVDLRNSGDTAGPRSPVVGYGAFVFEPPAFPGPNEAAPVSVGSPSPVS